MIDPQQVTFPFSISAPRNFNRIGNECCCSNRRVITMKIATSIFDRPLSGGAAGAGAGVSHYDARCGSGVNIANRCRKLGRCVVAGGLRPCIGAPETGRWKTITSYELVYVCVYTNRHIMEGRVIIMLT